MQNNHRTCALGKIGCQGTVHEGTQFNSRRNKTYQGFCCSKCKRFRSAKNALIDGEIRGARDSGDFRSFFATVNENGKSQTKIGIQKAITIIYCWAQGLALKDTKKMLDHFNVFYKKIFLKILVKVDKILVNMPQTPKLTTDS